MIKKQPIEHYLGLQYPFRVEVDPEGGYVVRFPDLPGCLTQADTIDEIGPMAEEARVVWIETEYGAGEEIPLPTKPQEYSGRFNLRLPKSLHARLAESAENEGVSLNQYVVMLLAAGEAALAASRVPQPLNLIAQNAIEGGGGLERLREMFLDRSALSDADLLQAAVDKLKRQPTTTAPSKSPKAISRRR